MAPPPPPEKGWAYSFDIDEADPETRTQYVQWRNAVYREETLSRDLLESLFAEDFTEWTVEQLHSCSRDSLSRLRQTLRDAGIWVKKDKGYMIAKALHTAVHEECIWPTTDVDRPNLPTPQPTNLPRTTQAIPQSEAPHQPVQQESVLPSVEQAPAQETTRLGDNKVEFVALQQNPFEVTAETPFGNPRLSTTAQLVRETTADLVRQTITVTNQAQQSGYRKEVQALANMYLESDKYTGDDRDSFDYKYTIFLDYVGKACVPRQGLETAFSSMLTGLAKDFYYKNLYRHGLSLEHMINAIKQRFETEERGRSLVREWERKTLKDIIDENPTKTMLQCLDILVMELTSLQRSLPTSYHSTNILRDKLLLACESIPECDMAAYKAAPTTTGVISDLQAAIRKAQHRKRTDGLVVNREFHINRDTTRRNAYPQLEQRQRNRQQQTGQRQPPKRCMVCGNIGCWSTQHTAFERLQAKKKLERQRTRLNQYITDFENDIAQAMEGTLDGDKEEQDSAEDNVFHTFIMNALSLDDDDEQPAEPTQAGTFTVSIDPTLQAQDTEGMITFLADNSLSHALTQQDQIHPTTYVLETTRPSRYNRDRFFGVMLDTGASVVSTAGLGQYEAFVDLFGQESAQLDTSTAGSFMACFGIGSAPSIGSARITTPMGTAEFHIVDADTPFLLSIVDMDRLGIVLVNPTDQIVKPAQKRCPKSNKMVIDLDFTKAIKTYPVIRIFGHPFMVWGPATAAFLTEGELKRLHRRFCHPSSSRLLRTLERAGYDDPQHRHLLEKIERFCHFCQKYARSPGRFKFRLQDSEGRFNHTIYVDVMYLNQDPVLHVVDEATRFQAARFLPSMSARDTWDALRACWIDTYVGPPDLCIHDAGKNFIALEFQQNAQVLAIRTKGVPVEAAQSMGNVERYHTLLRRAFFIISEELKEVRPVPGKSIILQMAVKAVNDTAGPDGLVPTLLVFGTYPRISTTDPPSPTIAQKALAIKKAMTEVAKLRAERQVADALRMRNGPDTTPIHDLAVGSKVLVWRKHENEWKGPYQLLSIEGETCMVRLPHGPTPFRTTVVKPFRTESDQATKSTTEPEDTVNQIRSPDVEDLEEPLTEVDQPAQTPLRRSNRKRQPSRRALEAVNAHIANVVAFIQDGQQELVEAFAAHTGFDIFLTRPATKEEIKAGKFMVPRQKELSGLIEKGVFEIVEALEARLKGVRIFNSRFVDEIKNVGTDKAYEKSRLVVQAYHDHGKEAVLTQAPTVQRVSCRILITIATMLRLDLCLRDISQAYTQALTKIIRDIYIKAPAEMNLPDDILLKIIWPLYGIPEAGTHWMHTYLQFHIDQLRMFPSAFDPCFLATAEVDTSRVGFVGLQIDDSLMAANEHFLEDEKRELEKAGFAAKERELLHPRGKLTYNGLILRKLVDNSVIVSQETQVRNIELVKKQTAQTPNNVVSKDERKQYVAQRARGAYIASGCQPERAFDFAHAAQFTQPNKDDIKSLNAALAWQQANSKRGLRFIPLDVTTLRLIVFTDSSFANNIDFSSQIGFVLILVDATGNANLLHWQSVKCRRVTRSVLASELFGMALGFDIAVAIKTTLDKFLKPWRDNPLDLVVATDSKSLYDCLVKLGTTREKRLMIDIMCLRQSYQRQLISEVWCIEGDDNPADGMTKKKPNGSLTKLVETNKLDPKLLKWTTESEKADKEEKGVNLG